MAIPTHVDLHTKQMSTCRRALIDVTTKHAYTHTNMHARPSDLMSLFFSQLREKGSPTNLPTTRTCEEKEPLTRAWSLSHAIANAKRCSAFPALFQVGLTYIS